MPPLEPPGLVKTAMAIAHAMNVRRAMMPWTTCLARPKKPFGMRMSKSQRIVLSFELIRFAGTTLDA